MNNMRIWNYFLEKLPGCLRVNSNAVSKHIEPGFIGGRWFRINFFVIWHFTQRLAWSHETLQHLKGLLTWHITLHHNYGTCHLTANAGLLFWYMVILQSRWLSGKLWYLQHNCVGDIIVCHWVSEVSSAIHFKISIKSTGAGSSEMNCS